MLDLTKKLSRDEIWQDCFTDRLTDLLRYLKKPNLLSGYAIDLVNIVPLKGSRSVIFDLAVSGGKHPLVYSFNTRAAPEAPLYTTPVDPGFAMDHKQLKNGYSMTGVETDFAGLFAGDILGNYLADLSDPSFDPTGPRTQQGQNLKPAMC